ncbi:cysteine hydrolase family protein [Candidatus Nitrosocosmicus sp. FF01]|uniref:cysteine hydrolase family protein n=1 Tax=Candidatus Nitrosocosmicus sp. FF01 TaxID=3397670 RepID=UPI0039EAE868
MYIELTRYAILVIDMQNDFVKGKLKCERASNIIQNIHTLLIEARNNNIPVFYCIDEHLPMDNYELNLWGPHAMKGTEGQKIIDELKPMESDFVIPKRTYSAFDGTGLDRALNGLYGGKGVDTIIITGLHTNICDRHSSYDAFTRGFKIIVAEDGVEAFTEEEHRSGLEYIKRMYGADIKKIEEIVEIFKRNRVKIKRNSQNQK